ncbi:MAG: SpoIIE family protein phosphatase, partial [Hyphomicrobiales bacterium]
VDGDYECQSLRLCAGERLVCFTDGLDPIGLSAGEKLPDWLSSAFTTAADLSMDEGMAAYVKAIQNVVGPEPEDDWTLIALEMSQN